MMRMQHWVQWMVVGCAATVLVGGSAIAEDTYPSEPIEVVTHASAGGGTDTTVRTVLPDAEQILGVPMPVAMKVGGSGRVALNYAKRKAPDGQTIMLVTPTHLFTMARGGAPLDIDDLVGIARATDDPLMIVASPKGRFATVDELIGNKGEPVRFGTTHIGSVDHAAAESFAQRAKIKINVVPFEGGGELVTNLMGGNIDVASLNLTEAIDQVQRGDLIVLAMLSDERVDILPNTPTAKEKGVDVTFSTVRGFVALKEVPKAKRDILEQAFLEAMSRERFQNLLKNTGMPLTSPASAAVWDTQMRNIYANAKIVLQNLGMAAK